ncbi:MAG: hypothetical protein ABWZ82_06840 [Candidatus Limnocylindrales bacterium]
MDHIRDGRGRYASVIATRFVNLPGSLYVLASALLLWDGGIVPRVLAPLCSSSGGHEMHDAGLSMLRRAIGDRNVTDLDGRPM